MNCKKQLKIQILSFIDELYKIMELTDTSIATNLNLLYSYMNLHMTETQILNKFKIKVYKNKKEILNKNKDFFIYKNQLFDDSPVQFDFKEIFKNLDDNDWLLVYEYFNVFIKLYENI